MGKGEIGPADILERGERLGPPIVPGMLEMRGKELEAAARDIGDQRIAVAEMAVGCCRADAGRAGGIRKSEPRRALFRDQVEGGLDQRFAQIAVMIPSAPARPLSRPAHVKCFYIKARQSAS